MPIAVIAVDGERASRAGEVQEKHGLGYADASAAELALEHGAWLVTAGTEFSKVGESAIDLFAAKAREVAGKRSTQDR